MQLLASLVSVMIAAASYEVPALKTASEGTRYEVSIRTLSALNEDVGKEGYLVSPEVDPILLAANQYFESRFRTYVDDGDCTFYATRICRAVGPMQIHRGASSWVARLDPTLNAGTVGELRMPERNVRAGYAILKHWKQTCGGTPGVWMTAYRSASGCPKKSHVDDNASARCAVATAMLQATGKLPVGWVCGHEDRKPSRRLSGLIGAILKDGV